MHHRCVTQVTIIGQNFSEESLEQKRIAERQKRLKRMRSVVKANTAWGAAGRGAAVLARLSSSNRILAGAAAGAPGSERSGGKSPGRGGASGAAHSPGGGAAGAAQPAGGKKPVDLASMLRKRAAGVSGKGPSIFDISDADRAPLGYEQCLWLLEMQRNAVSMEMRAYTVRAERDLARMCRRVLVTSRVLNQPADERFHAPFDSELWGGPNPNPEPAATAHE